ncbi:MAG: hypothetical protein O2803_11500 [Chloroflexi bacterium]|nr:hypothetical protein [Chloroflexota bacterium]
MISIRSGLSGHHENGRRDGGRLRFTLAEGIASTGLLVLAIGVTMSVMTSSSLVLIPGITYALAVGLAYLVYRHYLEVRRQDAARSVNRLDATMESYEKAASFRMDVHPLLETGWEDDLDAITPEWVDMPKTTFRVVASRGICPKGFVEGDFLTVPAGGPVAPALCPAAEEVLRLAAEDNSDVREWCCPIYDHLLVFKKLEKIT